MGTPRIRAKSILCCLLVLQLHVLPAGCGLPGLPGPDGWLSIPIEPGDGLDLALKGSAFEGARSIEFNVITHQFRLAAPGGEKSLVGSLGDSTAGMGVRSIRVSEGEAWGEATFDDAAKLALLKTSAGHTWQRPASWAGASADEEASLFDSAMSANSDLVAASQALDAAVQYGVEPGGTATGGNGAAAKSGHRAQAIGSDLSGALGILALLLGLQLVVGNFPVVYFMIQVAVSVSLLAGLLNIGPAVGGVPTGGGGQTPTTPGGTGGPSTSATARLRVSNVLNSGAPIWYVVPLPLSGEQPIGNLLGDEAIPAGAAREFMVPPGTRGVNIIVPTDTDCLRVYQWAGVVLISGETTELVQSDTMSSVLYPHDCGG